MSTKKKKQTAPHALISSELGLESAINRYVEASLALLRKQTKQAREIAALKAEHDEENRALETEIVSLETGVQLFCTMQRAVLFPDEEKAKSRTFGNATVGFRLNPWKVDKRLAKDTFDAIAQRVEAAEWGEPFVNTVTTLNKDELLKHRADLTAEQLQLVGIEFTQGETFFLEPDSDLLAAARKPVETEASGAANAA